MNIIMNPPYDGSLHLKILDKVIKAAPNAEIVNLSPIRWLQDPLAEYKKSSDWFRFSDIRKHIESVDVVKAEEATQVFTAAITMDLGIYHITNKGGWQSPYRNNIIDKVVKFNMPTPTSTVKTVNKPYFCLVTTLDGAHKERKNAPKQVDFIRREHWYGRYYETSTMKSDNGFTLDENKKRNVMSTVGNPETWDVVEFDTKEECINYVNYTKTKFFRYLYVNERVDVNIYPKFLPFMPTYTHPWTDEQLYEYFGLTEDEIQEIEETLI